MLHLHTILILKLKVNVITSSRYFISTIGTVTVNILKDNKLFFLNIHYQFEKVKILRLPFFYHFKYAL